MKAILSIRPEYVDRILSGEKKYEFRKRIFKREDVDTIVIYSTSPCCRVVAEASIAEIIQDSPERIWKKTKKKRRHREGEVYDLL
ncbi:ASCH domain-containing protein [Bifidobacterium breve]|uniref:ASCH domain-containing protein n=1 Tax=Bifidobacterium breve TaxID=1685 RepID=UPI003D07A0E7